MIDFRYCLNSEGQEEGKSQQYIINIETCNPYDYSIDELIKEIEDLIGEINIDVPQSGMYLISCETLELVNKVENICIKYEEIFDDEEEFIQQTLEDEDIEQ